MDSTPDEKKPHPAAPAPQDTLAKYKEIFGDEDGKTVVDGDALPWSGPLPIKAEGGKSGKYVFKQELGKGGLGRVVEAHDLELDRPVAVKMMLPDTGWKDARQRFLLEGRATGRLMHPNIVPVHEMGSMGPELDNVPFFTMGKVVGQDLGEIIASMRKGGQGLTRHRLLAIFREVCHAVAYAHDHGVLHRDLKPANIMVGDYGEVYVVDWGLAKLIGMPDQPEVPDRPDPPSPSAMAETDQPDSRIGDASQDVASGLGERSGSSDTGQTGQAERQQHRGPDQADQFAPKGHQVDQVPQVDQEHPVLTLDGQVMGTPAYMPPEQAQGRMSDVDERSDTYSLGAILYEILTLRPPFSGRSATDVLSKVLTEDITPPSALVSSITVVSTEAGAPGDFEKLDPAALVEGEFASAIPPELDDIVLRALAREKEERFATAQELGEEIQAFLEGEKQRERDLGLAAEKVAQGRALAEQVTAMRAELKTREMELKRKSGEVQPHWPVEKKRPYWDLGAKVRELRTRVMTTFGRAATTLQEALGFDRENRPARAALAELYWKEFLHEEEGGDRTRMAYFERLVQEYNDGAYDSLLQGDGCFTLTTRHYPCACLTEGRDVDPEELNNEGYHPCSGRDLSGVKGGEGCPDLEPKPDPGKGTVRLKVHGRDCKLVDLEGADAWLFRFEERDKILVPAAPEGVSTDRQPEPLPIPPAVLDDLYPFESPYRPACDGLYLGRTPLTEKPITLPMGSYLILLRMEGFRPVRLPVRVRRLAEQELCVTLYGMDDIPEGFVQVPEGAFTFQGDPSNPHAEETERHDVGDFFMARCHVTAREFLEYLNDLAKDDPEEAVKQSPRANEASGYLWPFDPETRSFTLPTAEWLSRQGEEEETLRKACRYAPATEDWQEEWPLIGSSWNDFLAFAKWKREKLGGFVLSLPTESQWEKTARGPDERYHPWGKTFDATFANMVRTTPGKRRPLPVQTCCPKDESPYGVKQLAGNARDLTLNHLEGHAVAWRGLRGGAFMDSGYLLRSTTRGGLEPWKVQGFHGAHLTFLPKACLDTKKERV